MQGFYIKMKYSLEFWNKEHIPQKKMNTDSILSGPYLQHAKNLCYTNTFNLPSCILTFECLGDYKSNGRKRMENTLNTFLVTEKRHTYLFTIDFLIETLGIRAIKL